nr:AraC family transcriptional regulator [Jiangella mangrovi]
MTTGSERRAQERDGTQPGGDTLRARPLPLPHPTRPGLERCERAVAALEADPARAIGALAAELGVSHGHLDREFTEVVGLSPRVLARILRLRVLLARLDVYAPVPWPALAAELGWFDQSHFIRDFKRHTGVTPSEYVAAQRGSFTPDQAAPGFVPRR